MFSLTIRGWFWCVGCRLSFCSILYLAAPFAFSYLPSSTDLVLSLRIEDLSGSGLKITLINGTSQISVRNLHLLELDRILRPECTAIIQDMVDVLTKVYATSKQPTHWNTAGSMNYETRHDGGVRVHRS